MRDVALLLLPIIALGCAGPRLTERARVVKHDAGWSLYSIKDQFDISAETPDGKVSYSSKTPGLIEEVTKGVAQVGTSIGQLAVTREVLNSD